MGFLIYEVIIVCILALIVWLGWRKGLILSLCGLVVAVVSFLGAGVLADVLDGPVADAISPKLETMIEQNMADHHGDLDVDSAIDAIGAENPLFRWAADAVKDTSPQLEDVVRKTADFAAQRIAHGVIFAVAFLLLYVLLTILLHALDLVAKLPGLNFCNELGGGIIGLVKGILIVFVAVAVLMTSSFQPDAETVDHAFLLKFFVNSNPILSFL